MSDDDAVCFGRLRIEDDSYDDANSNNCIEDHENEKIELMLRWRRQAQTEIRGDQRSIVVDSVTSGTGTSADGYGESDHDGNYGAEVPTKIVRMQNGHDDSFGGIAGSLSLLSSPPPTSTSSRNCKCTLICDAWYGFPTQKRPRRERINAVGRQISNFLEWRHRHTQYAPLLLQRQQQQSTSSSSKINDIDPPRNTPCHIVFLGAAGDVKAVQKRVDELSQQEQLSSNAWNDTDDFNHDCDRDIRNKDGGGGDGDVILFQHDVTVQDFLETSIQSNGDIDINMNDAVTDQSANFQNDNDTDKCETTIIYLSPDASYTLPITCRPPRTVILGMLVDRHTIANRSQQRAENILGMKAAQLPLKELNVTGLYSNEPLNVDTVMEMMQRWWWNCDELEMRLKQQRQRKQHCDDGDKVDNMDEAYRKCFLDAAAWALKSHRDRHPNRTLHS